jgi:hypothetical protein
MALSAAFEGQRGTALLLADALTRLRPGPLGRIAALAATALVFGRIVESGIWDSLNSNNLAFVVQSSHPP